MNYGVIILIVFALVNGISSEISTTEKVFTSDDFTSDFLTTVDWNLPTASEGILEEVFEEVLQRLFKVLDPIHLPYIPTLSFESGDSVKLALSLEDVTACGLSSNLHVTEVRLPVIGNSFEIDINFSDLSLRAEEYSAGGHIINVPFTGESYMTVDLQDLKVEIELKTDETFYCFKENSTTYYFDIRKPVIYFDDLNPGTDQGLVINTILSGMIPDLVDYFTYLFNNEWHETIDNILIGALNSIVCNRTPIQ